MTYDARSPVGLSESQINDLIMDVQVPNGGGGRDAWQLFRETQAAVPTWQGALMLDIGDATTSRQMRFEVDFQLLKASESNDEQYLVITLWLENRLPQNATSDGVLLGALNDLNREPGLKFRVDVPMDSEFRQVLGGEVWLVVEAELPVLGLTVDALRQALDRLIVFCEIKGQSLMDYARAAS